MITESILIYSDPTILVCCFRRQQFVGTNFLTRKFKSLFKHPYIADPTMSGQSSPHPLVPGPLAPGPSGAALPTDTLTTTTPADCSASAHDQAGFLGSGPKPPVLSQEMFHFFATAIRQHRQARVGQEVSQVGQEVSRVDQEVSQEKEVRCCLSSLYPTWGLSVLTFFHLFLSPLLSSSLFLLLRPPQWRAVLCPSMVEGARDLLYPR